MLLKIPQDMTIFQKSFMSTSEMRVIMKALILSWCKMVLFLYQRSQTLLTHCSRYLSELHLESHFFSCSVFSFSRFSLVLVRTKEKDSAPKVITTDQEMAVITKKALPSAAPHLLSALSQFISHNEKTPCVCSSALLQMK